MNLKKIETWGKRTLVPALLKLVFRTKHVTAQVVRESVPQKILLVKLHHKIGDLLCATPLLPNLRAHFPNAQIDFFAGAYNKTAIVDNPSLSNTYIWNKRDLFGSLKKILTLQKNRYDICLVVSASSFSVTTSLVARLCGARICLGYEDPSQGFYTRHLYHYSIPLPSPWPNEALFYLGLGAPFNMPILTKNENLFVKASSRQKAKDLVRSIDPFGKCIGIHPGGSYPSRMWPLENHIALCKLVIEKLNMHILLFWGGPRENEIVNNLRADIGNDEYIHLIPNTTFIELAAIQSESTLFIGNDTGTLHSACAVGCPTIGLYRETDPKQWKPQNETMVALIRPSVDEVFAEVEEVVRLPLSDNR